ncbi:substrate-binding domain-containing protein [Luteipulveratus sp. YIM 133132]|uniref:Substrate-binding domain-containing protein n=1 Tax=Luteipulveratus flavus TaxID=3031728 RepID=A0ABT6CGH0_9MICO|nr:MULTISPECIES: substrate-binding domain-containing protein [unclassified Luteipulveratus]MDE9364890.1 substrate-binding domain-containing protein [Luteipulveratus sp. YIM 133132]MDF8266396.1 substrate-binding domain-containing protein [Luteipulveratus sp. YIM 133296]
MGRHSAAPASRDRSSSGRTSRAFASILTLAVVALLAGGGWWFLKGRGDTSAEKRTTASAEGCLQEPLRVATTAELAPVINDLTKDTIGENGCAQYVVTVNSPVEVAHAIRSRDPQRPAVWIPDTPVWTQDKGLTDLQVGPTIATSPSMIAVPASLAGPATTGIHPWKQITSTVPFLMDRPQSSSATLLSVTSASRVLSNDPAAQSAFAGSILQMSHVDTAGGALLDQASGPRTSAKAFPSSEQAIATYNQDNPQSKLSALVPTEGVSMLRYPFIQVKGAAGATQTGVDGLKKLLTGDDAQVALRSNGFRIEESDPGPSVPGKPATLPKTATDPTDAEVVRLLDLWNKASQDSRQLVVIDVSGSMDLAAGSTTRIKLARDAGLTGLAGLPKTSEIGLWRFSTNQNGANDYKEMEPIRRLDAKVGATDQYGLLTKALKALPGQTTGDTGLYDTVLAAYRSAMESYNPNRVNSVTLVTDGANDDPKGGISLEALVATLNRSRDPHRPISVVLIGVGPSTDQAAMSQIAKAAGGTSKAYLAKDPQDIKKIFFDAVMQRQASSSS